MLFPTADDYIDVFWIQLDQPRTSTGLLAGDQRSARTAERVEHDITAFRRIADRPFHQCHRLHRRVQIVLAGLVDEPDVALIPRSAPEMIRAFLPAIEDRLVLPLLIRATEREGVLGPDHKGRPMATGRLESGLQGM